MIGAFCTVVYNKTNICNISIDFTGALLVPQQVPQNFIKTFWIDDATWHPTNNVIQEN